ncbi:MAG: hypothetical protein RL434_1159 [Pseudomonadota bacterium]
MTGHFPVSSAQARTWFLERWLPGTSQYHIGQAWRLEGELSLPALTAALQALIARHESLRTGFEEAGGEPRQCIVETLSFIPRWVDLSGVPAAEQEGRLTAELTRAFEAPFDLASPPLLRLVVWQLGPGRHVMLLVMHHIVSDGWSRGILRRELGDLYARALRSESLSLSPLPLQYADYALWQRELMTSEAYRESLARWKAQLSGLEPLELPTDHPRTAEVDYTGGLVEFTVAPRLVTALKALAREQGATLYMVLLAAMQVLLMRLTHQRDIAVGSPVAGRGRSELEGLVGFFVNTLVMRTALDPHESFTGLLARVREGALEAYGQAEVPFEELVRVLNPVRDASRHPLFQVMLALQNLPPAELSLTGLVVRDVKVPRTTTKFDLGMNLIEREGALEGMLEYASALFDAATMQRWVGHYLTLLSGVVNAPETPVGRIPVLTEAERARQWAWNEAATGEPLAHTLHEMFETQVRAAPEALAVVGEGGHLTYAALDARAEAVARGLRGLGVELGTRVGVCLPRSLDLVVGVLGILKAGGTYVPLDPTYPSARLAYMAEDAGLALVLVDDSTQPPVLPGGVRCVEVTALARGPGPRHWPRVSARDLAYVIYTSGSTGNPKGVLINHGAVCTHLQWLRKQFGFGPADRLLMRASTSFDASVWELFSALHSGSTLVLARSASDMDPEAIARDIREHAATAFIAVPAMLRALLAENHLSGCSSLRIVFAGGETLAASTVNAFHAQCQAELHNLYGPTEDSIWATWWPCPRENVESVPIGRPIPPVETWVLDDQGELLPEGIAGELYLGGAGLAEGYLNRPELTAEKFVAHPFKPGARLYRTGDRVRWLPDGNLEFLGRIDAQVKLRGYRIEPGEIEAALLAEGASQAAVILREDRAGDPRLVAYVAGVSVQGNALREAIRRRLPEFMVPSAVVVLSELPRTPNGKLDRKALPAPGPLTGDASRRAPETETEQALAELWSDILGVEQISRDDDFFALGGHSLLLLRLRARVNAHFASSLSMRQLFSCPLLKQQAVLVETQENADPGSGDEGATSAEPILQARDRAAFRRESRTPPFQLPAPDRPPAEPASRVELEYPASFAQERMWMRAQARTGGAPNTVNFAWRLRGQPDFAALQAALNGLIERHASLRTSLILQGDILIARVHPAMVTPFERAVSHEPEGAPHIQLLQRQFLMQPFDAGAACQMRAMLVALPGDTHVLLLAINHIAADGYSQALIQRDLAALYAAGFGAGTASLPVAANHECFARDERAATGEAHWNEARGWWQAQLATPPRLSLPLLRAEQPRGEGDQVSLALPACLWADIGAFARAQGVSTFTVCLTALTLLLHRLSGQRDLLIGTPVAHRADPRFSELVSCCLNDLGLRMRIPEEATGEILLARVAEQKRQSFKRQQIPIEQVIADLRLPTIADRHPLFDVMFNMIPWAAPSMALPGLEVTRLAAWQLETPFDLCFYLNRQPCFYESEEMEIAPAARLFLLFRRGRLATEDAAALLEQFTSVMEQLVADPSRPLNDYTLASPAARLREEGSPRSAALPEYPGVLTLILRQMVEHPQSIAIEQGDVRLTYADLAKRVAGLLALMHAAGVGRRDILALQLPRSPDLAAAFLATLCAGAVAMPVEPEAPAARMKSMLAHARWRLTLAKLADEWTLECLHTGKVLKSSVLPEGSLPPLMDDFEPNDPAYVYFTSGSTGEPKGILGRYAGLSQFIAWQTDTLGIGAGDRVSGLTVPTFDASLREIFLPLTTGGTLCLPPSGLPLDEEARWLAESRITVLHLVPSRLRAWLSADGLVRLPKMKFAIFSGEPLQGELVETLRVWLSETCRIVNFYGPTETTLIKSWCEVPKPALNGIQPIGVPIRDAEIDIRDQGGRACGEGEAGEIVIRTPFASLGYLGKAHDAWRFQRMSSETGVEEVEYRTGDLGCRDARGVLHILGRLDRQVKINGVRIEPEGIESLLAGHPAIRACAVVPASSREGQETRLIAWVVPVAEMPEPAVLRRHLSEWLSPAAIPSLFAPLEALPSLPNGKVNRAALAERQPDFPADLGSRRTAPDDPFECALAAIWKSLMPQLEPCREDDFFAVGGNSLMGVRLLNRLHSEHDLEINLRDLLTHSSLSAMAGLMRARASAQASGLPA